MWRFKIITVKHWVQYLARQRCLTENYFVPSQCSEENWGVRACGETNGLLGSQKFPPVISRRARDREIIFPFIHEMTSYSSGFAGHNFNYCKTEYYKGNSRDGLLADNISCGSQWLKEHSLLLCLGTPKTRIHILKVLFPPTETLGSVLNLKQLIKKSQCEFFTK